MAAMDWPGPNSNAQRIKGCYAMMYLSSSQYLGFFLDLPSCFVSWTNVYEVLSCMWALDVDQVGQLLSFKNTVTEHQTPETNCMK